MVNENFINKSKNIHGDRYDYSLVEYVNNKTKVKIICPTHGVFEQRPNDHLSGNGCPKCVKKYRPSKDEFINNCKLTHGDKYDYSLVEYKNNSSKVKIICPTHGVFEQRPKNHLYGQSCPTCSNSLTTEEFVNNARNVHGDKYDYSLVEYKNYVTKVKIICPTHGVFEQRPNDHLSGNGCPFCKTSRGESNIKTILDSNNIEYIQQHKFDGCRYIKPLPFDFYLPKLNTCIEYDGIQHFEPIVFFGGKRGLSIRKRMDEIKNKYCSDNDIILIRINYKDILSIYGY